MTSPTASVSISSFADRVRTCGREIAADDVGQVAGCGRRGEQLVELVLGDGDQLDLDAGLSLEKASTISCVAATRSGRSSWIQTVIDVGVATAAVVVVAATGSQRRDAVRATAQDSGSPMAPRGGVEMRRGASVHAFLQECDRRHCSICPQTRHMYAQLSSIFGSTALSTLALMPTGPGDVLDLIRHGRATTRGEVLDLTGLSRMTVAQRIDALLGRRADRRGRGRLRHGRPALEEPAVQRRSTRRCSRRRSTPRTPGSPLTDLDGRMIADDHVDVAVESGPSRTLDAITTRRTRTC